MRFSLGKGWRWPKRRELVFFLVPLLTSVVILLWVVYPRYEAWRTLRETISSRRAQVAAYQRHLKELRSSLTKPKVAPEELARRVFSGPDPYVMVAGLREKFEKIPEVSIRSFRITKREKKGDFLERVQVLFVLVTDVKGLAEVLSRLEEEPRAVRVRRLSVFFRRQRGGEKLSVTLEVEGLFWLKKA